jgi:hypothetical protein
MFLCPYSRSGALRRLHLYPAPKGQYCWLDCDNHVGDAGTASDYPGMLVHARIPNLPGLVVTHIRWLKNLTMKCSSQGSGYRCWTWMGKKCTPRLQMCRCSCSPVVRVSHSLKEIACKEQGQEPGFRNHADRYRQEFGASSF